MKIPCEKCICLPMCKHTVRQHTISKILRKCSIIIDYLDPDLPRKQFMQRVSNVKNFYKQTWIIKKNKKGVTF